jgi:ABC-type multidrug transport system ATPase subunit
MASAQRVRLAMASLHEPDVVLLDEPPMNLDDAGLEIVVTGIKTRRTEYEVHPYSHSSG